MNLLPGFVRKSLLGEIFLRKHFQLHRLFGAFVLVQWFAAFCLYWHDYERFEQSFLVWAVPLSGCFQTIIAIRTFTFLPKSETGQGFFTSKRVMSQNFIKENLYFATILCFGWFYMTDRLRDNVVARLLPLEYAFVFFPYQWRWLFPKTSFRTSSYQLTEGKDNSDINKWFFFAATYVTKAFYLWAKHFIGMFLNYGRFLDRITPEQQYHLHFLLIMSCFATTIAIFLQTLKFKGYMGAKLSFTIYFASYMATFYSYFRIYNIFFENADLLFLALGGLIINFAPNKYHGWYQVFTMTVCTWMRMGSPAILGIGGDALVGFVPQNVSDAVEGLGASVFSMFVPGVESGVVHSAL